MNFGKLYRHKKANAKATPHSCASRVSPNPSKGKYSLQFDILPTNFNLKVHDIFGKTIYTKQTLSQQDEFDITAFATGTYFVL